MSFNKKFFSTAGIVASSESSDAVCNTESKYPFGPDINYSSNFATYKLDGNANDNLTTDDLSTVDFPSGAGCIALYQLDSNANDTSGNYNGTASNISYSNGCFDNAAVFNGSSSKISLPSLGSGFTGSSARSVSAWVKISSNPSASMTIFNSGGAATLQSFGFFIGTSRQIIISYYNRNWETSQTISLNKWHHIVFTYNGGAVQTSSNSKIYIDGTLATLGSTTGSATGSTNTSDSHHNIGVYGATSVLYFNGKIDQVRLFTSELSQSQVTTLARRAGSVYNAVESSITYTSGQIDNAAVFDGYNSSIVAEDVSALNNLSVISISFWFNWDDSTSISNYGHMINIGDKSLTAGDYFGLAIGDDGNNFNRVLYGYFPDGSQSTGQTVTADTWHHVVFVYNGTSTKYYYDGSLVYTNTETALSLKSSGNDIHIGEYAYNGNHHFKGYLDQIRFFNREVSSSEVATLYAETSSTASNSNLFNEGQGVALYSFDYDGSEAGGLYTGTESGSIVYGVGGAIGGFAARFDGAFSYIDATGLYQKNIGSTSLWFKKDGNPSDAEVLFSSGYASTEKGVIAQLMNSANNGVLRLIVQDTGGGPNAVDLRTSGNYNDNNWHHVVFTWDITQTGSNIASRIYVDNTLVASDTIFGHNSGSGTLGWTSGNSTYDVHIGVYRTLSTTNAFGGDLDQMRFFDGVLTSDQVDTLYKERACVHTATTTDNDYQGTTAAYYKLDNSAKDEKGSYDGTESNIEYRFGRYSQAAVFNGSNSKITTSYTTNDSAFTISGWIKHTSSTFSGKYHYLAGKGYYSNAYNNNYWQLVNYSSEYPEFRIRRNASSIAATSSVAMKLHQWHHLAATVDSSGNMKIYLDGKLTGSATGAPSRSMSQGINYGVYLDGTTYFHDGQIDQIRYYPSVLDADAIANLYNEKPETDTSNFKILLYKGNASTSHYISNVGFNLDVDSGGDGGLVWLKNRSVTNSHPFFDTVRGAKYRLLTNSTGANTLVTTNLTSFEANGFFIAQAGGVNGNGNNFVAWVWRGGGDAVTDSTTGDISADISANTGAGFSIVRYTLPSSGTVTVPHGLSSTPQIVITKILNTSGYYWYTWVEGFSSSEYLVLNDNWAKTTYSNMWASTPVTSTTFSHVVGGSTIANADNIAYCFHSVSGYSKIGSYSGNSGTQTISTDFKASWIMIKRTSGTGHWYIYDTVRGGDSEKALYANLPNIESSGSEFIAFNDTSIVITASGTGVNASGSTYIYLAFK